MKELKPARKYHSEVLQKLMDEMENDPWHVKLKRSFDTWLWMQKCRTRFIWDLSYQHNIFKKNQK